MINRSSYEYQQIKQELFDSLNRNVDKTLAACAEEGIEMTTAEAQILWLFDQVCDRAAKTDKSLSR